MIKTKISTRLYAFLFLSTIVCPLTANAANAPLASDWQETPFEYVVVDQNIRDVLRELFATAAVPVEMSDAVRGHVRSRWPDKTVGAFLAHLSESNGLEWYFDGAVMHISKTSERETKSLPTRGIDQQVLEKRMRVAGSADSRYPLRAGVAADTVLVSGPPAFISTVEQSIAAISGGPAGAGGQSVTVFDGTAAPKTSNFSPNS